MTTTGPAVKTLPLSRQGKAMLVVASFGSSGDVSLNLDLKSLGVPRDAVAIDAESGAELPRISGGPFRLPSPRHDFRLVSVKSAGTEAPPRGPFLR